MKGFLDRCLVLDKTKTATYDVASFIDFCYGGDLNRRHSIFGRHHYSLLQLYPLLRLNISLQLRVSKKLHGFRVSQGVTAVFSDS